MPCRVFRHHVDGIFHNVERRPSEADGIIQPHQKQPRYTVAAFLPWLHRFLKKTNLVNFIGFGGFIWFCLFLDEIRVS